MRAILIAVPTVLRLRKVVNETTFTWRVFTLAKVKLSPPYQKRPVHFMHPAGRVCVLSSVYLNGLTQIARVHETY